MYMKNFLLSCLLLIVATSQTVFGQIMEPVHFSSSMKELSDSEAEIIFSATIDPGWHVYSTDIGDEGPIRATFNAVKMDGVKTVGSLRATTKPVEKYDDMMEWLAAVYVKTLNLIHYMHDKYFYAADAGSVPQERSSKPPPTPPKGGELRSA